jgi:Ca2+-binding EF-hand superfamily protein
MIDPQKLRDFDSSFHRFDTTGAGQITASRFNQFMNSMLMASASPSPSPASPTSLFGISTLDMPNSSTFSQAETDYLFRAYDLDGSGAITKTAARQIVSAVASRSPCTKYAILFRNLDLDRDSLLTLGEIDSAAALLGKPPGTAAALSARASRDGLYNFAAFYFFATGLTLTPDVDPYKFFRKMPNCCAVS